MLGTLVLSTVYVFSPFTPSCFSTFLLTHVFDSPDHPYTTLPILPRPRSDLSHSAPSRYLFLPLGHARLLVARYRSLTVSWHGPPTRDS
jgi:hypothetical protein